MLPKLRSASEVPSGGQMANPTLTAGWSKIRPMQSGTTRSRHRLPLSLGLVCVPAIENAAL